jgi:hypothetical protein
MPGIASGAAAERTFVKYLRYAAERAAGVPSAHFQATWWQGIDRWAHLRRS